METLGDYMRRYRAQNRMTAAELAEKLNCSESLISYVENGWVEKCSLRKFCDIVKTLQLSPEEIYSSVININYGSRYGKHNS